MDENSFFFSQDPERPRLETPNGKILEIYQTSRGFWAYRFTSGGELPQKLNQKFTSLQTAFKNAKEYIQEKQRIKQKKQAPKPDSKGNAGAVQPEQTSQ